MKSTSDLFIEAMGRLNDLEEIFMLDDPMRHEVRELRLSAYQILDNAINSAMRIAYAAKHLPKSARDAFSVEFSAPKWEE